MRGMERGGSQESRAAMFFFFSGTGRSCNGISVPINSPTEKLFHFCLFFALVYCFTPSAHVLLSFRLFSGWYLGALAIRLFFFALLTVLRKICQRTPVPGSLPVLARHDVKATCLIG